MSTAFADPTDPESRLCPARGMGETHSLYLAVTITSPPQGAIRVCRYCGISERLIRAEIAREEEE